MIQILPDQTHTTLTKKQSQSLSGMTSLANPLHAKSVFEIEPTRLASDPKLHLTTWALSPVRAATIMVPLQ